MCMTIDEKYKLLELDWIKPAYWKCVEPLICNPLEIEEWIAESRKDFKYALGAKTLKVKDWYERQNKELQATCGEAM